jgi:hypothetical protein
LNPHTTKDEIAYISDSVAKRLDAPSKVAWLKGYLRASTGRDWDRMDGDKVEAYVRNLIGQLEEHG